MGALKICVCHGPEFTRKARIIVDIWMRCARQNRRENYLTVRLKKQMLCVGEWGCNKTAINGPCVAILDENKVFNVPLKDAENFFYCEILPRIVSRT